MAESNELCSAVMDGEISSETQIIASTTDETLETKSIADNTSTLTKNGTGCTGEAQNISEIQPGTDDNRSSTQSGAVCTGLTHGLPEKEKPVKDDTGRSGEQSNESLCSGLYNDCMEWLNGSGDEKLTGSPDVSSGDKACEGDTSSKSDISHSPQKLALSREIEAVISCLRRALALDKEEEYKAALALYKDGIAGLIKLIKKCRLSPMQQIIRDKCKQFLSRAEAVKAFLDNIHCKSSDKTENSDVYEDISHNIYTNTSVSMQNVFGLRHAKETLKEYVVLPMRFPQLFSGGRRFHNAFHLIFGAPGTGKTLLVKALASEIPETSTFIYVHCSDLMSKFQGDSEKKIRRIFEYARSKSTSILVFDEIDLITSDRCEGSSETLRRLKTELLVQLNSVHSVDGVMVVLGVTNRPFEMHRPLLRRTRKFIYVPMPDVYARKTILQSQLVQTPNFFTEEDLYLFAEKTAGCTGSDIVVACRDLLMVPVREIARSQHFQVDEEGYYTPCDPSLQGAVSITWDCIPEDKVGVRKLDKSDLLKLLQTGIRPSVEEELMKEYREFAEWRGVEDQLLADNSWSCLTLQELCRERICFQLRVCKTWDKIESLPLPRKLITFVAMG